MSDLPGKERAAKWSAVFSDKTVRATYTHKGRAIHEHGCQIQL